MRLAGLWRRPGAGRSAPAAGRMGAGTEDVLPALSLDCVDGWALCMLSITIPFAYCILSRSTFYAGLALTVVGAGALIFPTLPDQLFGDRDMGMAAEHVESRQRAKPIDALGGSPYYLDWLRDWMPGCAVRIYDSGAGGIFGRGAGEWNRPGGNCCLAAKPAFTCDSCVG